MSEFGEKFRAAREHRSLSLDDVAKETRISTRFLRAIESESFEDLPGGLFSRGFIRTYAEVVGLDADEMVGEYQAVTRTEPPEPEGSPRVSHPGSEPGRERYVLPIAFGGLAVLVLVFYVSTRGGEMPASAPHVAEPAAESARPAVPPAPPAVPDRPALRQLPAATPEPESAIVPAGLLQDGASETEAEALPTVSAQEPETPETEESPGPVNAAAAPPAAQSASHVDVRVEVHDSTWLYVELDGEVMYDLTIHPPFWRLYKVNEALELKIGNPAGVSLSINGQPATLGPPGETWTGTITPENIASLIGG